LKKTRPLGQTGKKKKKQKKQKIGGVAGARPKGGFAAVRVATQEIIEG